VAVPDIVDVVVDVIVEEGVFVPVTDDVEVAVTVVV